jgi:hypothetical protein
VDKLLKSGVAGWQEVIILFAVVYAEGMGMELERKVIGWWRVVDLNYSF